MQSIYLLGGKREIFNKVFQFLIFLIFQMRIYFLVHLVSDFLYEKYGDRKIKVINQIGLSELKFVFKNGRF